MNRDQCPCAGHVACGEALVPVHARNRDECPLKNRDECPQGALRCPGRPNRDECIAFVRVRGETGMNALIGSGRKLQFLLVEARTSVIVQLDVRLGAVIVELGGWLEIVIDEGLRRLALQI